MENKNNNKDNNVNENDDDERSSSNVVDQILLTTTTRLDTLTTTTTTTAGVSTNEERTEQQQRPPTTTPVSRGISTNANATTIRGAAKEDFFSSSIHNDNSNTNIDDEDVGSRSSNHNNNNAMSHPAAAAAVSTGHNQSPPEEKSIATAATTTITTTIDRVLTQLDTMCTRLYDWMMGIISSGKQQQHRRIVSIVIVAMVAVLLSSSRSSSNRSSIVLQGLLWMIHTIVHFGMTILGTTIGIALGIGFATHVYDQFEIWEYRKQQQKHQHDYYSYDSDYHYHHFNNENDHDVAAAQPPPPRSLFTRSSRTSSRGGGGGHPSFNNLNSTRNVIMENSNQTATPRNSSSLDPTSAAATASSSLLLLQDEQSYHSLMVSAGYHTLKYPIGYEILFQQQQQLLRGQVHRTDQLPLYPNYPLTGNNSYNNATTTNGDHGSGGQEDQHHLVYPVEEWKAVIAMREIWPHTPACIQTALGKCIEYILRDFVAMWYCKADIGCPYIDPTTTSTSSTTTPSSSSSFPRTMMYSVAVHKPLPFYDALYEACAMIFGNLATRVEHVNIMELLLLKWTRILAYTFKSYRTLRKNVVVAAAVQSSSSSFTGGSSSTGTTSTSASPVTTTTEIGSGGNTPKQGATTSNNATTNATTTTRQSLLRRSVKLASGGLIDGVDTDRRSSNSNDTAVHNHNNSTTTSVRGSTGHNHPPTPQHQQHVPVSEIAMTKEFLFAGKLHRALTFGMDVPAFLFTDANGKECGKPKKMDDGSIVLESNVNNSTAQQQQHFTDDEVLAARLFETNLIAECELDYNRVLGHRMVRALLPRNDFGSAIVSSILTEIMAGCVLSPIMSLFAPETINGWIIAGLATTPTPTAANNNTDAATTTTSGSDTSPPIDPHGDRVQQQPRSMEEPRVPAGSTVELVLNHTNQVMSGSTIGDHYQIETAGSGGGGGDAYRRTESDADFVGSDNASKARLDGSTVMGGEVVTDHRESARLAEPPASSLAGRLNSMEGITMALAKALIDLQEFVDFEECRVAALNNEAVNVDWDSAACQAAVVQVVLVVEAALNHGRCTHRGINNNDDDDDVGDDNASDNFDDSDRPVEVTLPEYESTTYTQILMELTSDVDAFEQRIASENATVREKIVNQFDSMVPEPYHPSLTDQSTIRTLITVWMHSGLLYKTILLLVQSHATILAPYYGKQAFLRSKESANEFVRQLRPLENVEIVVDTLSVQASPRLQDMDGTDLEGLVKRPSKNPGTVASPTASSLQPGTDIVPGNDAPAPSMMLPTQFMTSSSTPRYLDFNRNESFAASLRSERERRMQSWERTVNESSEDGVPVVHRKRGSSEEDKAAHNELHHLARIFFAGTNMLALRDAGRWPSGDNNNAGGAEGESQSVQSSVGTDSGDPFALLLVETVCPKRRIEVPDDDSSFLLRAQPRPLNAVGVHRDQRNHDQSFKCFAATYDEPVLSTVAEKYSGRYVRRCLIRYYPIDRTASVALQNDVRKMDQRKIPSSVPSTITLGRASRSAPFLSADFLKERHLCNRVQQKGSTKPQSILSSSVMEATDFTSWPRPGKAIDFVYRMSFFERPALDLGGKRFTVTDATALGAHRADASALEMSDASLSAALLLLGSDDDEAAVDGDKGRRRVEMGKDGYPVVWMKFSRNQDDAQIELKQYRTSFVRAALMITAARQEAQLRCLVHCVKAGSAKKATKALTDAYLKPTVKLIDYAGSPSRGKQSILLRDLKLGVTHIDRGQLRRNALLSPRYPTELLDLTAVVEDVVDGPDSSSKGVDLFGGSSSTFKIKCAAVIALVASDEELRNEDGYRTENGSLAETYKEEWVIYRTMKEFQTLHKHLKVQVSMTESSGTAGSRLVGAATAAFSATTTSTLGKSRQRKMLIPSLSSASKTGALGVSKKVSLKRKEILDGYLGYLLSPGHLLGRSSEVLLFLGASFPLAPNVRTGGEVVHSTTDPLGRTEMLRSVLRSRMTIASPTMKRSSGSLFESPSAPSQRRVTRYTSINSVPSVESQDDDIGPDDDDDAEIHGPPGSSRKMGSNNNTNMIPAVKNKIDKILLAQVRNRIFELLRYQFGFDNASFARNRLLAALKTASFAVTTPTEFRKMLYKLHTEHLNSDAIAGWIHFLCDTLWPDGVFFTSKPTPSKEELQAQAMEAKDLIHGSFPDQVRAILGQELTRDGMDIFHEMLQNRMVVKSMAYMLFDTLWLEVFPEIGDVLPSSAALDLDS